jgi:4-amino-4-deoxy-L-arabinose transferase-like glycosyltransferase
MSTAKKAAMEAEPGKFEPDSAIPWLQPPAAVVWAVLLATLILFGLIRYRLRDMPLERDEGEYAYSGQLLLQGIPPYQLAYNMKSPGIYAAYAAILWVFGETPAGIHCGLIVVNAATLVLLYLLVGVLFGRLAAIVSACSWALLSAGSSVMGFEAHATNFVLPPAILGILLLIRVRIRWWVLLLSGISSGVAVLMKQHGAFFVLFCLLYLLFAPEKEQDGLRLRVGRAAVYVAGAALPYALTCVLLQRAGVFAQFWFWTVSYAGEYSKMGARRALHAFVESSSAIVAQTAPIWILVALGLTALWWGGSARRHSRFLGLLLLCSFLSLCPGAYFRPHYFVLILPAAAILTGVAISSAIEKLADLTRSPLPLFLPILGFLLCFGGAIFHERQTYFKMNALEVFESIYPGSPFVAAAPIAEYVKNNSAPTDRIAVIGSEPEIYFYAHRPSATGYIYMYSLIVRHKYTARMREEFIRELETSRPKYLVYADVEDSWGERSGVQQAAPFLAWLQKFMKEGYEREGVADLGAAGQCVWGNAARAYRGSSSAIYVLRRRSEAAAQELP